MSELQQKIDTILSKRKVNVDNILKQMKVINDLKSLIFDIKRKLKESNLDNAESYIPRLEGADKKLAEALQKLEHLKNRFDRETINIGVSGVSHAGKSTLLQAITGLSNNEIPKAEEGDNYADPTTAVRSQIYNGEKHAIIKFRSIAEFIKMVNEYLAEIKSVPEITSLSDFEQLNLNQVDYQSFVGNEKYNYERVKSIKESFEYFRNSLGGSPKTITDFKELKKYVAYNYANVSERLYPAVMEVEIYCEFPSLDKSIKLGLIDLPGFGENSNVDKIMTDGLENDVDHAVLIIRPNQQDAGIRQRELDSFSRIGEVQKGISKRSNFLSFLINKDERESGLDSLVNSTMQDINKYFNNGGENFKTFAFPVLTNGIANTAEVNNMLNVTLENLISVLPTIDNELLETYKSTLDISDVKALLNEIMDKVRTFNTQNRDAADINKKAISFHNKLRAGLRKLYFQKDAKYNCGNLPNIDDKEITKLVYAIKERVDGHINGDFWVVADDPFPGYDTWEDYIIDNFGGKENQWVAQEMHRLWVSIIKEYETLDNDFFKVKLQQIKKDIMDVFKSVTGTLVTDENEDTAIDQAIKLLSGNGFKETGPILDALIFLKSLKIDFRQNIYPMFYKYNINEILAWTEETLQNLSLGKLENSKKQVASKAISANQKIAECICNNDFLDYYLYCAVETFTERIAFANEMSDDDINLCDIFRDKLYNDANSQKRITMRELANAINNAFSLINNNF